MKKEKNILERIRLPRIRVDSYIDAVWFGEDQVMFRGHFDTVDLIETARAALKDYPGSDLKSKEAWLKKQTSGGKKIWWIIQYPV
jgi:hypothetical protein